MTGHIGSSWITKLNYVRDYENKRESIQKPSLYKGVFAFLSILANTINCTSNCISQVANHSTLVLFTNQSIAIMNGNTITRKGRSSDQKKKLKMSLVLQLQCTSFSNSLSIVLYTFFAVLAVDSDLLRPSFSPGGALTTVLYGGPCQQFVADLQILSHCLEEPQILSLKILRP